MPDVAIVGAGPSGSVAAKMLSQEGFSVTLFDKERLPRHKHCAGFISQRSSQLLRSLGIDCTPLLSRLSGFEINCGEKSLKIEFDEEAGNAYRDEFDYFLTKKAEENGAEVVDSTKIDYIERRDEGRYVLGGGGISREFDVVIGADGVYSYTRRYLGISYPRERMGVSVEADIVLSGSDFRELRDRNYYYIGFLKNGYGWVFPRSSDNSVNIGVWTSSGDALKSGANLRDVFSRFLGEQGWYHGEEVDAHGYLLPFKGTVDELGRDRVLLVGDAAGFVGLAGEGIPYAVESGMHAAESVKEWFDDGGGLVDIYTGRCRALVEEINEYHVRLNGLFFKPAIFNQVIRMAETDEYVSGLMGRLATHSTPFNELVDEVSYWRVVKAFFRSLFR